MITIQKILRRFIRSDSFLVILFFIVALLPRLVAIDRYVTPDELIWVYRSVQFREALLQQAWLESLTTGHPGVTTMWLGTLGIQLQLAWVPEDRAIYDWLTYVAWYAPENVAAFSQLAHFLTAGRLMVALANSLGVVAFFALTRLLFGRVVAFVATILLAFDPFVVGLSGLLHVDGLMMTFTMLSLLALAIGGRHGRFWWGYTAVSGVMASLAVLSKSPALLLLPCMGLVLLIAFLHDRKPSQMRFIFKQGVVWLIAFITASFVFFPALWVSPAQVIELIGNNANRHVENALRATFFLGELRYDHGPLFYPIVLLFRLSPIVFAGFLLALGQKTVTRASELTPQYLARLMLWLWSLLFVVGITFAAKKFDRYVLPAIPALLLLAALAWHRLGSRYRLVLPLVIAGQLVYLWMTLPYPLLAFNPIVGGPYAAQHILTLGWGESIGAAGQWLATQPMTAESTAVSGIPPALAPFFPGKTLLAGPETTLQADYIIITANGRQSDPDTVATIAKTHTLEHTIHFNGLDQAWIYRQAEPRRPTIDWQPLIPPASFGNQVELLATATQVDLDHVTFWSRWQLSQPINGRYTVRLTLFDDRGQPWQNVETDLLNQTYFYPAHWQLGETPEIAYTIDLPPAIPPGEYTLALSLFDTMTTAQLPLLAVDGIFQGMAYERVVPLTTSNLTNAHQVNIPIEQTAQWDILQLKGHDPLPERLIAGGKAIIDLYWQATTPLTEDLTVSLTVGEHSQIFPLSSYMTSGQLVHEKYTLAIPPDLPAGQYPLQVRPLTDSGEPLNGPQVMIGHIEIIDTDRVFAVPDDLPITINAAFASTVHLRGADLAATTAAPGTDVKLTLYWQTAHQQERLLTAFVHILGPDEYIITQGDQWPGGLPSDTWANGQVLIDAYTLEIPADTPSGIYQLAVGLYTADDGIRLPITQATASVYPDERLILPIQLVISDE